MASPIDRWLSNPSYKYNDQTHNWEQPKTYPAYDLKPEDTKSLELGLNMSFLDNTITVDATYYKSNTYHQTIYVHWPLQPDMTTLWLRRVMCRIRDWNWL